MNVDELMPQVSLDQAARYYGVQLPDLKRIGSETRTACFLNCGKKEATGDRALAIQTDDPAKKWHCHQYGCSKGGNLVSLCDLLKPGPHADGRPRGDRFKEIRDDLQAMISGQEASPSPAPAVAAPPVPASPPKVNVPLKDAENERARALVDLDRKFVIDIATMSPSASAYFRRRPYLAPEVCRTWRMGYLPSDVGGQDRSGGTMRGKITYAYQNDAGEVISWFGRDPSYEDKYAKWDKAGKEDPEPQKFHFVKGFLLEPGCGSGNFMSLAPPGMRFIGVELDSISGRIARALHPDQDIRIENFRDSRIPPVDGVIGNPPFANVQMEYQGTKMPLHDFFIAKSVDALKPSGILAVVTSHFTLDKQNASIREFLGERADFIGAIRLPSDAFKREGTAVVTDILFMRKRPPGESARHEEAEWQRSRPFEIEGMEVPINRYFVRHAEMVLGTWSRTNTLYGGEGYSVVSEGELTEQLQAAIGRLPKSAPLEAMPVEDQPAPQRMPSLPEARVSEGSFFLDDQGRICQCVDGQSTPVVYGGRSLRAGGTHTAKRLAALIRLRDLARRVLQSQNEGLPEAERNDARRELNWAYDRFVIAYGPINKTTFSETTESGTIRRMPNLVKFREDPDAMLVMSLEDYDEATGKAAKAAIMSKDVVGKHAPITTVRSAEEGLLVSLDQRGNVDLSFIASLYGKSEEQVVAELGDLVFHNPESRNWETADAYLSGNVRAKLAAVLNAGPAYAQNAEKLQSVQPEDVLPGDIDANLGAPWIPVGDIQAFAAELFGVEPSSVQVGHLQQEAAWSIEADYTVQQSVAATSDYGTSRARGSWLMELALNMKTPAIYDTVMDGGREERVLNHEATMAAREKQKLIKERFRSWVFTDPERTERLVRLYNDTYNNLRPRLFDGSHLDFPGMNETIRLRAHQRHAIWRCMSGGNTLLAQAVGAGKTFIMAATGPLSFGSTAQAMLSLALN